MKFTKLMFAAAFAFASSSAYAFHSGGVAECEGCHSMHNSFEGAANVTQGDGSTAPLYQSGPYLLKAQDQSGACLNCHASADTAPTGYHIMTKGVNGVTGTVPTEFTPGGDFGWLKTTRPVTIRGATFTYNAERSGHSIVASDFGLAKDSKLAAAPGGTYPADKLACSSCHDPHGRYRRFADGTEATTGLPIFGSGSYGSSADPIANVSAVGAYRILGGVGYQPKSLVGNFAFANRTPAAAAPSSYNRAESKTGGETHVAYGQGMAEWCSNCHTAMLENSFTSGMGGLVHPAGKDAKLTAAIVGNYNAYVTSGIMTNTDPTKAYTSMVPFELGTRDYTVLKPLAVNTNTKDQSATTSSTVSCLSCHRAHASGFESMARYNLSNEFMTIADSANGNAAAYDPSSTENKINYGLPVAFQTAAYNGRPASDFGPYARNLCNKCHAKD